MISYTSIRYLTLYLSRTIISMLKTLYWLLPIHTKRKDRHIGIMHPPPPQLQSHSIIASLARPSEGTAPPLVWVQESSQSRYRTVRGGLAATTRPTSRSREGRDIAHTIVYSTTKHNITQIHYIACLAVREGDPSFSVSLCNTSNDGYNTGEYSLHTRSPFVHSIYACVCMCVNR